MVLNIMTKLQISIGAENEILHFGAVLFSLGPCDSSEYWTSHVQPVTIWCHRLPITADPFLLTSTKYYYYFKWIQYELSPEKNIQIRWQTENIQIIGNGSNSHKQAIITAEPVRASQIQTWNTSASWVAMAIETSSWPGVVKLASPTVYKSPLFVNFHI